MIIHQGSLTCLPKILDNLAAAVYVGNIAQASEGVRDANERVSHTAEVSKSIAKDIAGVNSAVAEIREGGEHVQASAIDLSNLAEKLGAQVAQFRI